MAGSKKQLAKTAIKLGTKYGPQVWVAAKALKEPAKEAATKVMAAEKARKDAMAHAKQLSGGSILKTFSGDRAIYIVFSGDTAVSAYPATPVPLTELIKGVDLTARIRPSDVVSKKDRVKDVANTALKRGETPPALDSK